MADWGPVVMAVVLFVLLTPRLLCQIPGKGRVVEFVPVVTSADFIAAGDQSGCMAFKRATIPEM
ncbi:hypothetical protein RJ640_010605 [Escallonia rubra]|uniref:Uncharacterized protein n=1 Tax=Escallonia rubra TaxID=112253 RepID=A0AA88R1B4_9ASTE|nr:hypothetical protein RJ640_010605 [Escallonia rubra]